MLFSIYFCNIFNNIMYNIAQVQIKVQTGGNDLSKGKYQSKKKKMLTLKTSTQSGLAAAPECV